MDNKSTTKRMIGAVVLVLIAALLLAWLLKGKNRSVQEQELIAQQTQTSEPILGFPGVNQEGEGTDAGTQQLADTTQGGQQEQAGQEAPYTMGTDGQQQAQDGAATAAAGDASDKAATGTDGSTVAGKTDDSTGFQIRDPGSNTEQRVIVENGEVKTGIGSMGTSEVASAEGGTDGAGAAEQAAVDEATRTAEAAVAEEAAKAEAAADQAAETSVAAAQEPRLAPSERIVAGGTGSSGSGRTANPTLVNEKPVPAPRTQTAAASSRSSGSSASVSASASGSSTSSGSTDSSAAVDSTAAVANSGSGYAIQVLAASSASKAENVRKSIAEDGYPTFVVKANVNGKTVYRVRIGSYPQRNAAVAVQNRLKARYTRNQYVQNSFVTRNN
ncbi:MAG TPA: SPOR domain-containing protein [Thiolinea sp.]|nr:SPOR domain-containing protein [Thiolinea sp.]